MHIQPGQEKEAVSIKAASVSFGSYLVGAEGGIRTHTPVKVADFKSAASTIPPPRPLLLRYPPFGVRRLIGR